MVTHRLMDDALKKRIDEANLKFGWHVKYDHNGTVILCDKRGSNYDDQLRELFPQTYLNVQLKIFQ